MRPGGAVLRSTETLKWRRTGEEPEGEKQTKKEKNCTSDFPMMLTDVLRYASAVHEYFI